MTILGLHVIDRERALFWVDSEMFNRRESTGPRCKLAVNAMGLVVGAGTGWADVADEGDRVVMSAAGFDEACDALPDRLRKAAVKAEPARRDAIHTPFCANLYAIAGWSQRDGRVIGYSFSAWDFFRPTIETSLAVPAVDMDALRPIWPADVLPIARAQMARLRETHPDATGETLCVTDLRPDWLAAIPFNNFAARCAIDRVAETAPARSDGGDAAPAPIVPALRVVA
jgi:hypothetical protein